MAAATPTTPEKDANSENDSITLVIGNQKIECSKEFLITHSDYFANMFNVTHSFVEKNQDTITLHEGGAKAFRTIIDFLTPDGSSDEEKQAKFLANYDVSVLQTAAIYLFPKAMKFAEKCAIEHVDVSNCVEYVSYGTAFGAQMLHRYASYIAAYNFEKMLENPNFISRFKEGEFEEYILSDYLKVYCEKSVVDACIAYCQQNPRRKQTLVPLIKKAVRWAFIDVTSLNQIMKVRPLKQSTEAKQMICAVFDSKLHELNGPTVRKYRYGGPCNTYTQKNPTQVAKKKKELSYLLDIPYRTSMQVPMFNVAYYSKIHPVDQDAPVEYIREDICFLYRGDDGIFRKAFLTEFEKYGEHHYKECLGYNIVALGRYIYIIGGEYQLGSGIWNTHLYRFDMIMLEWKVFLNLAPIKRRHSSVVTIDNKIYVLGGIGRHRVVSNVVGCYDPALEKWFEKPPLPERVNEPICCAMKQKIYFFTSLLHILDTTETVDVDWVTKTNIKFPDYFKPAAALPYGNKIYLPTHNGHDLYVYDPIVYQSPSTEKIPLALVGTFHIRTEKVCLAGNRIYNLTDMFFHRQIECYDILTNTFRRESVPFRRGDLPSNATIVNSACFKAHNFITAPQEY